jgi:hypothetical protein
MQTGSKNQIQPVRQTPLSRSKYSYTGSSVPPIASLQQMSYSSGILTRSIDVSVSLNLFKRFVGILEWSVPLFA